MHRFGVCFGKRENGFHVFLKRASFWSKSLKLEPCFVFVLAWPSCVGTQVHVLNSWHEISDFVTSYDPCIRLLHNHVLHVLQRETQVFPDFVWWGLRIHTSARRCGTSAKTWMVPSVFTEDGSSAQTPSMFCLLTWIWRKCRDHSHVYMNLFWECDLLCDCRSMIFALSLHLKD